MPSGDNPAMDIVTHAALGASLAAALAPSHQRRLAAGIGLLASLLPDADALIQSGSDPLLVLDYHRHFTHALIFIPVGALIAALLLWPMLRHRMVFSRLYLYSVLGYGQGGVMDACTSYGTHLLWPFSESKLAWNLISVFDPVFTLLLLVPLILTLRRPGVARVHLGLALASGYLCLGYLQQQRVTENMLTVIARRGHTPDHLTVKPTLGNQLLWRSLYRHDGRIQVDATHAGWALRHYAGQRAPLFESLEPADSRRSADIERFRRFSDGWLVETAPGYVGDARYAMLPTTIAPIWGITWADNGQLQFVSQHEMTPASRRQWLRMLAGRDLSDLPQ